jgi:hypothetical protein
LIGKVCRRGSDTRWLLVYLFTEGSAGERGLDSDHRDARVIAGYDDPRLLEPGRGGKGRADVGRLAALLDATVRAGGVGKDAKPVYHLALSAAPADRTLSDADWADIAAQYLDRLGLAKHGDSEAVRWVAVRHADNHVHVVATLVRQDGRRVFPHHDFYRAREASLEIEKQYGLTATSPVDRTAGPEITRAERRKHQAAVRARAKAGLPPPAGADRDVLRGRVRSALAGSQGWEEFADRLRCSGVLVRERYSTRDAGEITGYAVALPALGTTGEASVWFGGGKLAPDLSLPQLQARWHDDSTAGTASSAGRATDPQHTRADSSTRGGRRADGDLSKLERRRLWLSAQQAAREATDQIRPASSPHASEAQRASAQAAATAASEMLHAVSSLVESKRGGPLRAAADSYDRAARDLHRRTVPRTASSRTISSAAGALLSARIVKRAETRQLLALLSQLSALCETVALLRETQGRAAQARAARQAAEDLAVEHARRTPATSAAVAAAAASAAAASAAVAAAVSGRASWPPVVGVPTPTRVPTSAQTRGPSASR